METSEFLGTSSDNFRHIRNRSGCLRIGRLQKSWHSHKKILTPITQKKLAGIQSQTNFRDFPIKNADLSMQSFIDATVFSNPQVLARVVIFRFDLPLEVVVVASWPETIPKNHNKKHHAFDPWDKS